MYFNDIHILVYAVVALIGFFLGSLVNWCNYRMPKEKKVFSKEIFQKDVNYKNNLLIPIITMAIYIALLYIYGFGNTFLSNLSLIKYLIITPMLLSAFVIDYKYQIIPNRLNLTIFQIGIILLFIAGIFNFNIAIEMFLGLITGGGIFLLITVVGGLIAGKEAMGFGDVKFMCGIGIFFGFANTIAITLMAFLIGAIVSIIVMIIKKSKTTYVPFGPFIVIGTFIAMFVPFSIILKVLITVFSLGTINI